MYDKELYELTSDLEIDMLLSDLPFELIKENIKEQIKDPLLSNVNYINIITEKRELLLQQFENNIDYIKKIDNQIINFFTFIITEINNTFDLGIDMDQFEDYDIIEYGQVLYNFFILRYRKNVSKFIYKFIIKNKKFLIESFETLEKKKDVTHISLKKQIKNKDDLIILINLPNIIKYIFSLDIDNLDFLKHCCNEELYESIKIKELIISSKLNNNFVRNYLELVQDKYDNVVDEIQTEVKYKIIKKIID